MDYFWCRVLLLGQRFAFFQISYHFSKQILTLSFCSWNFCVLSAVSTLLSNSTCAFAFPSQPALLEPPLIFPHHFYFLARSAWFQLLWSQCFVPWTKRQPPPHAGGCSSCGGVTPCPLRAVMLLSAACELGAIESGLPGVGDCPLHLSRDGVQMCSTNDAGGLSYEFRTIWKAEKTNSCLFCHCLRRGGGVWCWKQPSGRLPFKEKDEVAGCLG